MKLLKKRNINQFGVSLEEPIIKNILFNKYKFNDKVFPKNKNEILIITCFSEFGCESLALLYCLPEIIKNHPNHYVICVGWFGRAYLYKHLCDEYWEIKEEFQWLREYSYAFRNSSKNLSKLDNFLESLGVLFKGASMGQLCVGNKCKNCNNLWSSNKQKPSCPKCSSLNVTWGLLNNIKENKNLAVPIPAPSKEAVGKITRYLKPNSVGIFARSRKCYGRNLTASFYIELINFLKNKGYNPIWLGERQSVLPCPVNDITDFSIKKESNDLELTLALLSKLNLTIQFWTASTRLASMVNTPWILFESPEQIVGHGQEGIRICMTSDENKRKIIVSQYNKVKENELCCLPFLDKAIEEINNNNWKYIVGPSDNPDLIEQMMKKMENNFEFSS